jgi:hypothetical protein
MQSADLSDRLKRPDRHLPAHELETLRSLASRVPKICFHKIGSGPRIQEHSLAITRSSMDRVNLSMIASSNSPLSVKSLPRTIAGAITRLSDIFTPAKFVAARRTAPQISA